MQLTQDQGTRYASSLSLLATLVLCALQHKANICKHPVIQLQQHGQCCLLGALPLLCCPADLCVSSPAALVDLKSAALVRLATAAAADELWRPRASAVSALLGSDVIEPIPNVKNGRSIIIS